ncbi:hypothetical protein PV04_00805 [Phialophora macrospora]|uniref:Uncharacterized protein n=1 Tax=Phialophora macrospora TaxID=1851006 RepID=A0A0D2EE99_9EURO|nr:hypothetical protein PV04_00805 [Phialophora macrospora]
MSFLDVCIFRLYGHPVPSANVGVYGGNDHEVDSYCVKSLRRVPLRSDWVTCLHVQQTVIATCVSDHYSPTIMALDLIRAHQRSIPRLCLRIATTSRKSPRTRLHSSGTAAAAEPNRTYAVSRYSHHGCGWFN